MTFVDLHVHSIVSDGTMTPEEIVQAAKKADVSLLAIADHELAEGSIELKPLCHAAGIGYLSAAENTCAYRDGYQHVLSYGVDLFNEPFRAMLRHNRAAMDWMSVELIRRMAPDYPALSSEEYDSFERDVRLGGWKGLDYLFKKGIAERYHDGMRFYGQYNVAYRDAGFMPISAVIDVVHQAGGKAVLAHPGEMLKTGDLALFERELAALLELGLDGVECYYPTHSEQITDICLRLCRERGLIITTGSDCHGTFTGAPIGSMQIGMDMVDLRGMKVD